MDEATRLSALASLLGDAGRARMLTALMSGMALTATELAMEADVAPSTASSHLAKLVDGGLLAIERQGRHRYFRLYDKGVAEMLESFLGVATRSSTALVRGTADEELREARVCYDHLAGSRGVWLFDRLRERGHLEGRDAVNLSPSGTEFFSRFGIDVDALVASRRAVCRTCLDWTERRHHLSGALGAAVLEHMFALRWLRREPSSRVLTFTANGKRAFLNAF